MNAIQIPTQPGALSRLWRRVRIAWLRSEADAVRKERRDYQGAGVVGPIYLLNSIAEELELRRKAKRLELGQ
jgi:hypothetical protein